MYAATTTMLYTREGATTAISSKLGFARDAGGLRLKGLRGVQVQKHLKVRKNERVLWTAVVWYILKKESSWQRSSTTKYTFPAVSGDRKKRPGDLSHIQTNRSSELRAFVAAPACF